jgi:hypothetical protein
MRKARQRKAPPASARANGRNDAKPRNLIRGRFRRGRLPEVEAFSASLPFDRRLFRQDIRGSIAHARMLAQVGLLKPREARAIEAGLLEIEQEIANGRISRSNASLSPGPARPEPSCIPRARATIRLRSTCGSICVTKLPK